MIDRRRFLQWLNLAPAWVAAQFPGSFSNARPRPLRNPFRKNGKPLLLVVSGGDTSARLAAGLGAQPGTGGFTYNQTTGKIEQATQVTLKAGLGRTELEETAVHEGVHVEDRAAFVNSIHIGGAPNYAVTFNASLNITGRQSEINAYTVENAFRSSMGLPPLNIQEILARPPYSDNPLINQPIFGNLGP